ncbi:MAG: NAD(P)-binding oxidoreductase [Burkholderiales bacterium]
MRLVVLGGTRGLGHAVGLAALAAGHTLTVLARHAADLGEPAVGVRMVIGDVTDAADVERAVAGHDAVVWAVRPAPVRQGADAFETGIPLVVAAMRGHGVRRLLCVSCGAGRSARARFTFRRVEPASGLDLREAPVRGSGLAWTVIRTAALTNGPAAGAPQVLEPSVLRPPRVARADVAAFIVAELAQSAHLRRTVLLAG